VRAEVDLLVLPLPLHPELEKGKGPVGRERHVELDAAILEADIAADGPAGTHTKRARPQEALDLTVRARKLPLGPGKRDLLRLRPQQPRKREQHDDQPDTHSHDSRFPLRPHYPT